LERARLQFALEAQTIHDTQTGLQRRIPHKRVVMKLFRIVNLDLQYSNKLTDPVLREF
jgi:hypothetical protein